MLLTRAVILAALAVSAYALPGLLSTSGLGSLAQAGPLNTNTGRPTHNELSSQMTTTDHQTHPHVPFRNSTDDESEVRKSSANPARQESNNESEMRKPSRNPTHKESDDESNNKSETRRPSTNPTHKESNDESNNKSETRRPSTNPHHNDHKDAKKGRPDARPVRVPVRTAPNAPPKVYEIYVPVDTTPVVQYTSTYINYRQISVFTQTTTFQYSSCRSISQDLSSFLGGFGKISATFQTTQWSVEQTVGICGEVFSNFEIITQEFVAYDYTSDGYPGCHDEMMDCLVTFLRDLQILLSLIPQRFGAFDPFQDTFSYCYSSLQRFFGVVRSMNLDIRLIFNQVDTDLFSRVKFNIASFQTADIPSLLQAKFEYQFN